MVYKYNVFIQCTIFVQNVHCIVLSFEDLSDMRLADNSSLTNKLSHTIYTSVH